MGPVSAKSPKHNKKVLKKAKILAVGDGAVGKTCALISFTKGEFPHDLEYTPTIFENYITQLTVANTTFDLDLWDTAGQEDYDSTRQLSYARTDMFMVCFSVDSKNSLDNVEHKWIPDILKFVAHEEDKSFHYKYVLIGTKIDLRTPEKRKTQVSAEAGQDMARKLGACGYYEMSSLTREGLMEAFQSTCMHIK